MPSIYSIKPKQVLKLVQKMGYSLNNISGSHHVFKHPETNRIIVVPFHNKDMKVGTLKSIIRSLQIDTKTFLDNI